MKIVTLVEIMPKSSQISSDDIFSNGIWLNRYYQYGLWHGPFQHRMSFDESTNRLTGYGEDNVGRFVLNGSYSKATRQINLVQSYIVISSHI